MLRTERLILRPPAPADAPRIAQLACDFDVVRMTTRMPWPYTLADAVDFVARIRARQSEDDHTFLIEMEGRGPAGMIGFFTEPGQRLPEVGYWLGRPFWGLGLATEAGSAALAWAADVWGRRGVRSGYFADNEASGRVLVKLGFLYTGEVLVKPSRARGKPVPTRMMIWLP